MPYSLIDIFTSSFSLKNSKDSGKSGKTHGRLVRRKLRRQRKLRHVTDEEIGLDLRAHSVPGSPDSAWNSRFSGTSEHWPSCGTSPKPLPLPELPPVCFPASPSSSNSSSLNHVHEMERKSAETVSKGLTKSTTTYHKGLSQAPYVACVSDDSRLTTSSRRTSLILSPARSDAAASLPPRSPRNGYNTCYNTGVNAYTRSAPTSNFSSPAVSPQRSNPGDSVFVPVLAPHQKSQSWSTFGILDTSSCSSPVSPVDNVRAPTCPPRHSLTSGSSPARLKSICEFQVSLNNQFIAENSKECIESVSISNAHPLPLPPGASQRQPSPFQSTVGHRVIKNPTATSNNRQWKKGKLIGRGTFGSVYLGTHRKTGASCAMKEVNIIADDPKSIECMKQLKQEIKVLSRLSHPNIVRYYGSEIIENHFYIYLEYVFPGSVNKYIRKRDGALTESVVRSFTRHILSGLAFLHSKNTIHRDIKCANLLVDGTGTVKIADFGLAKHVNNCPWCLPTGNPHDYRSNTVFKIHVGIGTSYELSLKGSPYWVAPELLRVQPVMPKSAKPNLALAVDIWSLGCAVIEMLNGKPPWSEFNPCQAMYSVLHEDPPIPEALSSQGKDFLRCCFRRNPAERPSADMLLKHPFVQNSIDQNRSLCSQQMDLVKTFYNPIDEARGKSNLMLNSPCPAKWATKPKQQCTRLLQCTDIRMDR